MSPHVNLPQKLTPGSIWQGFQIHHKIGSGAMGVVYCAQKKSSGRRVALKILHPGEISHRKKRFYREVQLAARLDYPGIVRIYKAEVEAPIPYLVMQYVEGVSFKEYCKQPEISLEQKLKLIVQVAKALNYTHEQNVLHRDLKPSNILVNPEENLAYIVDFGLAKTTEVSDHRITRTGAVVGTIDYMSPEQAEGNPRNIDSRTDIYSLGVILYELCTQKSILTGDTDLEKLFSLTESNSTPPSKVNQNIDKNLERIILQATSYEKENRYSCAKFLAEDLEQYLAQKPLIHCLSPWRQFLSKRALQISIIAMIFLSTLLIASLFSQNRLPKIPNPESPDTVPYQEHKNKLVSFVEQQNQEQFLYHVYQINKIPNVEEALWIVEKLNDFGYFSDAHKFLEKLAQSYRISPQNQEKVYRLFLENAFHRNDRHTFELYAKKDVYENNFIYVRLLRALFEQSAGEWFEVEKILPSEIYAEEFPPYWQSYYWYAKSRLKWNKSRHNMMSIVWLVDIQDSSTTLLEELKKEVMLQLSDAQSYFEKAYDNIEQSSSKQCTQKLKQILDNYGRFLHWEKQNPADVKEVLSVLAKSTSLKEHTWNGESAVRAMIFAKDWNNANKLASSIIEQAPWTAQIYLLRSIARAQLGYFTKASQDSIRFSQLYPWEFSYLSNMAEIICNERLTQEEYLHYEELIFHYLYSPKDSLTNYLFRRSYQSLFSRYTPKNKRSQQIMLSSKWQTFVHRYEKSQKLQEEDLLELAELIGKLKEKSQRDFYLEDLKRLSKKFTNFPLQNFIDTIQQEKQSYEIEEIRKILCVYAPFYQYSTLQEIVKNGIVAAIKVLAQIIRNPQEQPAMRMIAAIAMTNLGHPDAWAELTKITQESYPANLIAATAMNDKFPTNIPEISPQELFAHDDFYLIHFCRMINPSNAMFQQAAPQLLEHNNPRVLLAICHRILLFSNETKIYLETAESILRKIIDSSNIEAKEIAFQIYFNTKIRTMHTTLPSSQMFQFRINMVKSYWRDEQRQKTLLELLASNSPRLRQVALLAILGDDNVREYLNNKDAKTNPFVKRLFQQVETGYEREKNIALQHWYLGAMLHLDTSGKTLDKLMTKSLPSYLRSGVIAGVFAKKNAVYFIKILKWLEKKVSQPDLTGLSRSEKMQLQLLIMTMMQGKDLQGQGKVRYRVILTQKLYPKIVELMASSDHETSRIACSVVSYFHKPEVIPLLKKRLKSKNSHLRRAAITSLVHLLLKTKPELVPSLQQQLKKAKPIIKRAATMGYQSVILENLPFLARYYKNNNPIEKYFWYLHRLKVQLHRASEKEKKAWILAYKYMIELNPQATFFYEQAFVHINQKNFTEALASINSGQAFLQNRTDNQSIFFLAMLESLRGRILFEQGRIHKAKIALKKAVQINPLDRDAYYYLGKIHLESATRERFYWQAYLNGNFRQEFLLSYSKHLFDKGERRKAIFVFQKIDRAYPISLTQKRIKQLGLWQYVGYMPWVLRLPIK